MPLISKRIAVILAILLQAVASEQDTLWHVHPVTVAIRNAVLGLENDNCVPLDTPDLNTDFVHCHHPTTITDSDKSEPSFTQDTPSSVYIWSNDPDQVLFTFSSQKVIDSITIHYFANEDNQGFPKLRFFAVPEDFEVTDIPNHSYPTRLLDAVTPGNEGTGLRNMTKNVSFNTTKILMTKGHTRNYQFYLSEIEFFTSDPDSVDEVPTTISTTTVTSPQTAPSTTPTTDNNASTETTTVTETETETEEETTLGLNTVEVEVAGLSGDSRTQSRVNTLYLIALTLFEVLVMFR